MTRRRNSNFMKDVLWGLSLGIVAAVLVFYAVPAASPLQPMTSADVAGATGSGSVHAKNQPTPDWILELQTRNARQLPVPATSDEPSFWI